MPIHSPSFDLQAARAACADVARIEWMAVVDSTNAELMRREFDSRAHSPRVLVADAQTQGRGRLGRPWSSPAGHSLAFSLALERNCAPAAAALAGWPIAVGAAAATALVRWAPDLQLKWPNDLLRHGAKCGGILIEARQRSSSERVVVGIGLNLTAEPDLSDRVGQPAGALFDDSTAAADVGREQVLAALVTQLVAAWGEYQAHGLESFVASWATFDALAGEPVCVSERGCPMLEGVALGLHPSGALRVLTDRGEELVMVGDVSVRRVARPPIE